jgi:hypothetical protein
MKITKAQLRQIIKEELEEVSRQAADIKRNKLAALKRQRAELPPGRERNEIEQRIKDLGGTLEEDNRTEVGNSLKAFMEEHGGEMGPTVGGIRYIKFKTDLGAKKAKKALDVARIENPELTRGIVVTRPSIQPRDGSELQVKRGRDYRRG